MIANNKDLNLMKVTAAGINRDTLDSPTKMKNDLLETSFQISFQKELDQYKTNNSKLFKRHKLSAAMLEESKATKDSFKAHDAKTNWGLRQVSQLSQRDTDLPARDKKADDNLII